jgi:hypothetical protein
LPNPCFYAGKSLLKIRLKLGTNNSIPIRLALARSVKVWWRGLAAGIPFVSLITLSHCESDLTENSATSWDMEGGFSVVHEKIGKLRVAIAALCVALVNLLTLAGEIWRMGRGF